MCVCACVSVRECVCVRACVRASMRACVCVITCFNVSQTTDTIAKESQSFLCVYKKKRKKEEHLLSFSVSII